MSTLTSTNPVLSDSALGPILAGERASGAAAASLQGVMQKTSIAVGLAIAGGAGGYWLVQSFPSIMWIAAIASLVVSLVMFFALSRSPKAAAIGTPIYAIVQGVGLGALSFVLEAVLKTMAIAVPGGLAMQAFVVTGSIMASMLALHTFGIVRAGPRFTSVLAVVTLGIFLTYLVSFILSFFSIQMPFLSLGSALEGGSSAWIGLGINGLILVVASLWLLVDLAQIDEAVAAGAPKSMEWMLAFGLVVSLAWVYAESLKMLFRLYAMFGRSDD
ncbi:MAG: Bax inhibitor-1/YccA family protein [Planctomycetota bacterium]